LEESWADRRVSAPLKAKVQTTKVRETAASSKTKAKVRKPVVDEARTSTGSGPVGACHNADAEANVPEKSEPRPSTANVCSREFEAARASYESSPGAATKAAFHAEIVNRRRMAVEEATQRKTGEDAAPPPNDSGLEFKDATPTVLDERPGPITYGPNTYSLPVTPASPFSPPSPPHASYSLSALYAPGIGITDDRERCVTDGNEGLPVIEPRGVDAGPAAALEGAASRHDPGVYADIGALENDLSCLEELLENDDQPSEQGGVQCTDRSVVTMANKLYPQSLARAENVLVHCPPDDGTTGGVSDDALSKCVALLLRHVKEEYRNARSLVRAEQSRDQVVSIASGRTDVASTVWHDALDGPFDENAPYCEYKTDGGASGARTSFRTGDQRGHASHENVSTLQQESTTRRPHGSMREALQSSDCPVSLSAPFLQQMLHSCGEKMHLQTYETSVEIAALADLICSSDTNARYSGARSEVWIKPPSLYTWLCLAVAHGYRQARLVTYGHSEQSFRSVRNDPLGFDASRAEECFFGLTVESLAHRQDKSRKGSFIAGLLLSDHRDGPFQPDLHHCIEVRDPSRVLPLGVAVRNT
jgi:hypothetical protein